MENEDKTYFYDDRYYTLEEISNKYKSLAVEQKKDFKDAISHFILVEILKKCDYDERIIESTLELAKLESDLIECYGCDCGRVPMTLRGMYDKDLRKLLNLTGKLASRDDSRINSFKNGEWFVNNLICLTIGSSFEKDIIDDLFLINYNTLTKGECLAIADNYIRTLKGEKILFYDSPKRLKR